MFSLFFHHFRFCAELQVDMGLLVLLILFFYLFLVVYCFCFSTSFSFSLFWPVAGLTVVAPAALFFRRMWRDLARIWWLVWSWFGGEI
jgi:hypothetical protein